jgi:hypothetical protein
MAQSNVTIMAPVHGPKFSTFYPMPPPLNSLSVREIGKSKPRAVRSTGRACKKELGNRNRLLRPGFEPGTACLEDRRDLPFHHRSDHPGQDLNLERLVRTEA